MKNLRIRKKLILCFSILFLAVLAIGVLALYNQSRLNNMVFDLGVERRAKLEAAAAINTAMSDYRIAESAHVLAGDLPNMRSAEAALQAQRSLVAEKLEYLEPRINKPTTRAALEKFKAAWARYRVRSDAMLALSRQGDSKSALTTYHSIRSDFEQANTSAIAVQEAQSEVMNTVARDAQSLYGWSRGLTMAAVGVVAALLLAILSMLVRGIARPLTAMTEALGQLAAGRMDVEVPVEERSDEVGDLAGAMTGLRNQLASAEKAKEEQTRLIVDSVGTGLDALARGDLTARVDADLTGPFAKLKADFNNAMDAVETAMTAVSVSATGITNGASDIRQASDDLSQRTEQQAASLEETAAAMHEITTTVRETAQTATRADAVVVETRRDAEASGEVVRRAVEAMNGIERSSTEISEIIAVIDGIAFQTNLLALNAGVEAARAGDAGKGFAVVASEVRALAQRSADAAKDVKAKITASTEQVDLGVGLVAEAGAALQRITGRIGEISTLVGSIASAAEQQATGLQQVNTAVSEMDGVTQQNAAMVEEATAAARSLADETDVMTREIARFRLDTRGVAVPAASSPVHQLQARAAQAGARIAVSARATRTRSGGASAAVQENWSDF